MYFSEGMNRCLKIFLVAASCIMVLQPVNSVSQKKMSTKEQAIKDSLAYVFELNKSWSLGWENYKNKQYADVLRHFWRVVKLDTVKRFPKIFRFLGQSYFELGLQDSAQYVYDKGLKIFPDDVSLRRNLAYLYTAKGQKNQAILEYEKIRQLGVALEDDLTRIANLYVSIDKIDKAIEAYEAILTLNPENNDARNILSALYKNSGDDERMLESMEKALLQNSDDRQTLFNLAKARYDLQQFKVAVVLLERYEKLNSNDALATELKADALQKLGRYDEALKSYKQIIATNPQNKKVLVDMGVCYSNVAKYSQARIYTNKAIQLDSEYGYAFFVRGQIYQMCADTCVSKKEKENFSDKLVYKLAYEQYRRALNNIALRSDAKQRMAFLKSLIPTNEDYFMNKNQDKPLGPCYEWIY